MSRPYQIGDIVRNKKTGRVAKVCALPYQDQCFLRVFIPYATGYKEKRAWRLKNIELVTPNNNTK